MVNYDDLSDAQKRLYNLMLKQFLDVSHNRFCGEFCIRRLEKGGLLNVVKNGEAVLDRLSAFVVLVESPESDDRERAAKAKIAENLLRSKGAKKADELVVIEKEKVAAAVAKNPLMSFDDLSDDERGVYKQGVAHVLSGPISTGNNYIGGLSQAGLFNVKRDGQTLLDRLQGAVHVVEHYAGVYGAAAAAAVSSYDGLTPEQQQEYDSLVSSVVEHGKSADNFVGDLAEKGWLHIQKDGKSLLGRLRQAVGVVVDNGGRCAAELDVAAGAASVGGVSVAAAAAAVAAATTTTPADSQGQEAAASTRHRDRAAKSRQSDEKDAGR